MTNHAGPLTIEVCANSVTSALAAQRGGAQRVELCDNLYEGGTTPSAGSVILARKELNIGLFVMIRPRGGDFCYSELEFEIMKEDIRRVKDFGADGVVFGILKPDGSVDVEGTHELLELARPLGVTFHRAFDMTADPHAALEALAGIGVDRVLTSGQRNKAAEGAPLLAELVRQAGSRIAVMIGSGVNPANIARLIARTGAREFHVSGRKSVPSAMQYRNPNIFMGGIPDIPEYETSVTDEKIIHSLVEAAHAQA